MDKIIDNLYIGDISDANNKDVLVTYGISAILNLSHNNVHHKDIHVENYSINDGYNNSKADIQTATEIALDFISEGERLLINCDLGMSRSIVVSSAVVSKVKEIKFEEAFLIVREEVNHRVHPHPNLMEIGRKYI